jgi:FG-GAP-like repeat/FG-GAP repeat
VADFNGDGRKDVVATSADIFGVLGVSVLLGYGDGTFRGTWDYDVGTGEDPRVSLGEFNGDGIQDLAVLIPERLSRIVVLLGNGDGSFRWAFEFETGTLFSSGPLAVSELNGDRIQDLVMAESGRIAVFLGNGNGTFKSAVNFPVSLPPASIAVGYLNGDAFVDVAVIGFSSQIGVLLGNGDGTLRSPIYLDTGAGGSGPRALVVDDFNLDGNQDLVTTNPSAGSISMLLGNGDGTFRTPLICDVGGVPGSNLYDSAYQTVVVGHFNNDRIPDLFMVNTSPPGASMLLGNGDGTFTTAPGSFAGRSIERIAVGDFDRDGMQDLVLTRYDTDFTGARLIAYQHTYVFGGKGDGTFLPGVLHATTDVNSLAVGDFNGDGRPDIATVGDLRLARLSVLINNTP